MAISMLDICCIDYYTEDGTRYLQKSFTSTELPDEISGGQSKTYQITIDLPDNIASGYTNPKVEATTEIWRASNSQWASSDYLSSDYLSSKPKISIESQYKRMYDEQVSISDYLTNMMNVFIVTTIVFAAAAGVFFFLLRKSKPAMQQNNV